MTVKLEVFTSQSCPYCPMAVSVAEEMVKEFGDQLDYQHLDVNENMEKVREYQIMSVPTVVLNGRPLPPGAPDAEQLSKQIKKALLREK
jgi:small redox-active disulfide protein 1